MVSNIFFKKIVVLSVSVFVFVGLFVAPVSVSAQRPAGPDGERSLRNSMMKRGEKPNVCDSIDTALERVRAKLTERISHVSESRGDRRSRFGEDHQERRDEVLASRAQADERFTTFLSRMREQFADNGDVLGALDDFETTVEGLLEDRRLAVDAAMELFRSQMEEYIDGRQDDVTSVVDDYKAKVEALLAEIETACENGDTDVMNDLREGLASIRMTFKEERPSPSILQEDVQDFVKARNESIRQAHDDFKDGLAQAREVLKEVLSQFSPEDDSDDEDSGEESGN